MNTTDEVVGRAEPVEDMTAAVVASTVKTVVTTDCGSGEIMKAKKYNIYQKKFEKYVFECGDGERFECI